ncbi:hypothetical protein FBY03_13514 [Pseudomonas sp. SJZ079]|nr:hypothetical protein FBY03_13514 [Pseudomonas sp. SJZ079]
MAANGVCRNCAGLLRCDYFEALDLEWTKHGISVGDLMPPFVNTPMLANQCFVAPVMQRLGVKLKAEDIAAAVWQQAQGAKVHRPVSVAFKLMCWSGRLSPVWISPDHALA